MKLLRGIAAQNRFPEEKHFVWGKEKELNISFPAEMFSVSADCFFVLFCFFKKEICWPLIWLVGEYMALTCVAFAVVDLCQSV